MKATKLIMAAAFLAVIGTVSIAGPLVKDREFSENENRYLAEKPKFSADNLLSGKYQEGLENYLNDQIVFRDQWITGKTAIQKLCGDTDIGGAYVGSEGYDFEKILPEDVDEELLQRNTEYVAEFLDGCAKKMDASRLSFMLVPTSGLILEDRLPAHARLFDQDACITSVGETIKSGQFLDVRSVLRAHAQEEIYYHTDHHWTVNGAFLAYEEWCRATGHTVLGEESYQKTEVTDQFRGSLYSKILDYDSVYDRIWKMEPKEPLPAVTVIADGKDIGGIYQQEKLLEKDKYLYFFGGNYGEVQICRETGSASAHPENLLVIKDSFANSFVPFLTENYDHIDMLDLRYYNGSISAYMEEHSITDVLILYNISNFISDKNIYKLCQG